MYWGSFRCDVIKFSALCSDRFNSRDYMRRKNARTVFNNTLLGVRNTCIITKSFATNHWDGVEWPPYIQILTLLKLCGSQLKKITKTSSYLGSFKAKGLKFAKKFENN